MAFLIKYLHHFVNQLARKSAIGNMQMIVSAEFGLLDCNIFGSNYYFVYILGRIHKRKKNQKQQNNNNKNPTKTQKNNQKNKA